MVHPMLPKSAAGIPRTDAERVPQPATQPMFYGLMPGEDKKDEPGEEMAKDARVWKTYVGEADMQDKELVDGRNSSLDVLLIFAALFSAISTAFVIESLRDLRPDPAEASELTQQAMLQTQQAILKALTAVANGQPVSSTSQDQMIPAAPLLKRSTIAVNVLWLLSLALSVGVSLVAMLAKDWCHKFMSGRSGPLYEQGRRRQQKWDGIERWKMLELLAWLPAAMHLALLLFAVGLSIYLWGLHIAVAVPVTVVTGVIACGYLMTTVLPMVHRCCPYSTPITPALQWCLRSAASQVLLPLRERVSEDEEDEPTSFWYRIHTRIQYHCAASSEHIAPENQELPMDTTTSRMLAWLVTMCDDSRSADVALQAIAGASSSLPCTPLFKCGAHELLRSRLHSYADGIRRPGEYDKENLAVGLQYFRSYAALFPDDLESYLRLPEAQSNDDCRTLQVWFEDVMNGYETIFHRSSEILGKQAKPVLLAASSCNMLIARSQQLVSLDQNYRSILFSHWSYDKANINPALHALQQHSLGTIVLDAATVRHLLYSIASRLARSSPQDCRRQGRLYWSLAQLCLVSDGTAADLSRLAPVTLSVAAFMLGSYPGGEQPPLVDQSERSQRALKVLEYYQNNEPNEDLAPGLFAFGFAAVLPYLESELDTYTEAKGQLLPLFFRGIYDFNHPETVHTLPDGCSFDECVELPFVSLGLEPTTPSGSVNVEPWLVVLQVKLGIDLSDPQLYILALAALCRTRSVQLQRLCIGILDSQPACLDVSRLMTVLAHPYQEHKILRYLVSDDTAVISAATFYFKLLVANVTLCPTIPLAERQRTMTHIWSEWDVENHYDVYHHSSQARSLPTLDLVLRHVGEEADQQTEHDYMRKTLPLVADFCLARNTSLASQAVSSDWAEMLHDIRCNIRPDVRTADSCSILDAITITTQELSSATEPQGTLSESRRLLIFGAEEPSFEGTGSGLMSGSSAV